MSDPDEAKAPLSRNAARFRRAASPIREIMRYADPAVLKRLGIEPGDLVNLAGGWVNHGPPEGLRDAYRALAREGTEGWGYGPTLGHPPCRQAVVNFERSLFGMEGLSPGQVALGASSTQLLQGLLLTLADPGDTILLMDPTYCNYPIQALVAGLRIATVPLLDEDAWRHDAKGRIPDLQAAIEKERPRIVLLVSPDNPTSQVLPDAFVDAAVESAARVGGVVLLDFAYKAIVFSREKPAYFRRPPSDHFVTVHSLSKWANSLGRRLGWVEAPEPIIRALEAVQNALILSPDSLHQHAFVRFMETTSEAELCRYVQATSDAYARAAERTLAAVETHLGLPVLAPRGGLYTCVKAESGSAALVRDVLEATSVLFVPGRGFGKTLASGVRISYGSHVDDPGRIESSLARVGAYLRTRPEDRAQPDQ